ncbi:hypothetical protein [Paenibacillus medicaginis]|uniref:Uncharacterized protein n=1 Tax=Paenibacillus medicaginis TaxID=1470560 RepID=A0ABV5C740_9BACL
MAKQVDHVECYAYNPSTGGGEAGVVTSTSVNLTGVSTVTFVVAIEGSSDVQSDGIFIASTEQMGGGGTYNARKYQGKLTSRTSINLDVSALSGSYYLRAHATNNAGITNWKRVRLYSILLDGREIWNGSNSWTYV